MTTPDPDKIYSPTRLPSLHFTETSPIWFEVKRGYRIECFLGVHKKTKFWPRLVVSAEGKTLVDIVHSGKASAGPIEKDLPLEIHSYHDPVPGGGQLIDARMMYRQPQSGLTWSTDDSFGDNDWDDALITLRWFAPRDES